MNNYLKVESWFERNKDAGVLLLRLFVGIRLVYGVSDNVLSWDHMVAFEDFLRANGFPLPLVSATISVYAQLLAGFMIITGFWTRIAATVMIFNFLVAILMVHHSDSFEGMTPALAMLFCCILFLFYGGGKYALSS